MALSMERWVGKVAIVTGASSGIGRAIAERLVDEGLKVVGLARRKARLDELAAKSTGKKGTFHPFEADVTKEADILEAFRWIKATLGPVHVLINNAGVAIPSTLREGETASWEDIFKLNVIGLSIATREAVKVMEENAVSGHIIHINSIAGHSISNTPALGMYSASKHSVTVLTEYLRRELALKGSKIKITSLSPGLVDTEIITEDMLKKSELLQKMIKEEIILKPDDIVEAAVYVLSTPPRVQVHELTIRPLEVNLTK